jgi:hypothetical protein
MGLGLFAAACCLIKLRFLSLANVGSGTLWSAPLVKAWIWSYAFILRLTLGAMINSLQERGTMRLYHRC